jgi:hypothetical protein
LPPVTNDDRKDPKPKNSPMPCAEKNFAKFRWPSAQRMSNASSPDLKQDADARASPKQPLSPMSRQRSNSGEVGGMGFLPPVVRPMHSRRRCSRYRRTRC